MKYILACLLCAMMACAQSQAQTMSQSFGNVGVFMQGGTPHSTIQLTGGNSFQKANIVNNNDLILSGYNKDGKIEPGSYFNKNWAAGSVMSTGNHIYSENILLMFNTADNSLFYKLKDSAQVMKADPGKIISFELITDKPHIFIKADYFSKEHAGEFFEVLVLDEKKYSLFKSIKSVYEGPAAGTAAHAISQTASSGKYVDKITYFIYKDAALKEVRLKRKSFPDALNIDAGRVETYIKSHTGNFNESYVITMLGNINKQVN
jgi:hypothetical protein